ncbi:hypothetical protein L3V79_09240 [Thiotrichales bacterium 19S9-12]|nr:hypothetical protein [Thiotrichales bacterium 19S9-11]MCF6812542.1 hypothetical protein [Thiotrichales bacterium 19S9-12]
MNNSGNRVNFIRKTLLKVPRSEFIKFNIPETTFRNWEKSEKLSKKKCDKLSEIFLELGLQVSSDWLFDGSGVSPISCLNLSAPNDALLDIESFKSNNQESFVLSMDNDYMKPLLNKGDFIGGKKERLSWKEEGIYIIKLKNKNIISFAQRLTQKHVSIRYTTSEKIQIINFSEILCTYRVIFIRKAS